MAFEVQTASPGDSPNITEAFFSTFSDEFNRTMFPPTPEVRAWLESTLLEVNLANKHEFLLKVTDQSNADMVVAFAKWIRPVASADADQDRHENPAPAKWPVGSDTNLCDMFFGTMAKHHEELMEDRPHYCKFHPLRYLVMTRFNYAHPIAIPSICRNPLKLQN